MDIGVWRIDGKLRRVAGTRLEGEGILEDAIEQDTGILGSQLLIVGRQVPTAYGKFIDLLCMDGEGALVVIELKRDRTPRDVVAQALDYGSWVQSLTLEEIVSVYADYKPEGNLSDEFYKTFGELFPEKLPGIHRLLVVATELDPSTDRIIGYLNKTYQVPINALFCKYFDDDGRKYLARSWLIDPEDVEEHARTPGRPQLPWNGVDWYVNLAPGPHRTWDDCVAFGFVSAGQGPQYGRPMLNLTRGGRVFVYVPRKYSPTGRNGYVGVGIVEDEAVPVSEFEVDFKGARIRILDAPLKAPRMGENADDPDYAEQVVRVRWLTTRPIEDAFWDPTLFSNQNIVSKLRDGKTATRVLAEFGVADTPRSAE